MSAFNGSSASVRLSVRGRRAWRALDRRWRIARRFVPSYWHTDRPILVHLVPTRFCNYRCAYCREYSTKEQHVPVDELLARVDRVAELGTVAVALSGGEPMAHPQCPEIVRHIRRRGMCAGVITNGSYLSAGAIARLNEAGLDELQISIDNCEPDEVSEKSLRTLMPQLALLKELAAFDVTINSVLGGGVARPDDALAIAAAARRLGFKATVGLVHDAKGQLAPLDAEARAAYDAIRASTRSRLPFARRLSDRIGIGSLQDNLANGRPNDWSCRAGARYLYVDEHGKVQPCSQTRFAGLIDQPLALYTKADISRWYRTPKSCAPFCTIGCVMRVSRLDAGRNRHAQPPAGRAPAATAG